VIWLADNPVTVVGRNNFLAVVYHESVPDADGTQKLGCLYMDMTSQSIITKCSMSCISRGATLMWLGFGNDNSLFAMDSDGMLSMLVFVGKDATQTCTVGWEWMPMLDTVGLRKSSDDSYWPVSLYDGKLICVPLKGGTRYPDAARRPVTSVIGLRLPLARGTISSW
jgi:Minichromosome loss protein, Mcl1, middle region